MVDGGLLSSVPYTRHQIRKTREPASHSHRVPLSLPTGPLSLGPGVSQPCIQTPALPVASFTTRSSFLDLEGQVWCRYPRTIPAWQGRCEDQIN